MLLTLALICLSLFSCGGGAPSDGSKPDVYAAAELLLRSLGDAAAFSLDGRYTGSFGSGNTIRTDTGHFVGAGSVKGGSLSATLSLLLSRVENGAEKEIEAEYAISGDTLSFISEGSVGETPLASLFPFEESAECTEALLTLLPFLSDEVATALSELGVGYSADGLYALFGELASLYRLLLLRVGQGQLLRLPTLSGDAAEVLAACGRVKEDESGDKVYVFLFPTDSVSALLDRAAELAEIPLCDLAGRLLGEGSAERLLTEIGTVAEGETLGSLLTRAARLLFGSDAEAEMLLSVLRALSTLTDTEELPDTLTELFDVDALAALRRLTGDLSLKASDVPALLSRLLSLSLDGLLSSIGKEEALSQRLSAFADAVRASRLSLSFPCKESEMLTIDLSYSFSGEMAYGYCSTSLELTLTLTPEK